MRHNAVPRGAGRLASLDSATTWLNSKPLTAADLHGRVVLINFCTYTCINWIRTLPHVRAWARGYAGDGLVVIGVHSPEFEFEQDLGNVARAAKTLGVDHPIAVDNALQIWRAFDNRYWPALHFIDRQGLVRQARFGENEYLESERTIQDLLAEPGQRPAGRGLVPVDARGIEAPADWDHLASQQTYLGLERTDNFASAGGPRAGIGVYEEPSRLTLHHWALRGYWIFSPQGTLLDRAGGRILYRFQARDLHLVMGPEPGIGPVRFRVLLDGQPPRESHGADVDALGNGIATDQRLYQLIRQRDPAAEHTFTITFLDPGVRAYAVTFG